MKSSCIFDGSSWTKFMNFSWIIHQIFAGETRTRVGWELRSESLHQGFLKSRDTGQTRTRVAWELRSASLHESFLKSRDTGQTRTRVGWELRSESLHESFLKSRDTGQTRTRVARELAVLDIDQTSKISNQLASKLEPELQLSSTFIYVWPGL
jgi:hypothetical protein